MKHKRVKKKFLDLMKKNENFIKQSNNIYNQLKDKLPKAIENFK